MREHCCLWFQSKFSVEIKFEYSRKLHLTNFLFVESFRDFRELELQGVAIPGDISWDETCHYLTRTAECNFFFKASVLGLGLKFGSKTRSKNGPIQICDVFLTRF